MAEKKGARGANATNVLIRSHRELTPAEVKTRLKESGLTVKDWANSKGYPYQTVSDVLRGVNRGTFGMGHRIAVDLGMKREGA